MEPTNRVQQLKHRIDKATGFDNTNPELITAYLQNIRIHMDITKELDYEWLIRGKKEFQYSNQMASFALGILEEWIQHS